MELWSLNTSEGAMNKLIYAMLIVAAMAVGYADAKWARVQDGRVMETFAQRPDFHPDVMATIVECPADVEPRWRKEGASWLPPKTKQELDREAFDKLRRSLLSMQGIQARKLMADSLTHRLDGTLESGYPDPAQPMCTNAVGKAITVSQFSDYVQECDDAGMSPSDLDKLKQDAKAARLYLKSLKGD
jgi:hypothetical protein